MNLAALRATASLKKLMKWERRCSIISRVRSRKPVKGYFGPDFPFNALTVYFALLPEKQRLCGGVLVKLS